jgi:hypothetical protein
MNVVVVGAKERCTEEDRELVNELLEKVAAACPNCVFVTMLTHVGVGKYVKEKCLEKNKQGQFRFQLIECTMRLFARQLSKSDVSSIYIARNATVFELGDAFYYFAGEDRRGTMEELFEQRVIPSGRPYRVFAPGEGITLI